jgi:hypothetical protein
MKIGYINGLDLGIGFNTATYDIHPTPALDNVSTINPVINAGGQQVFFKLDLASSTLSLSEQLSISARASLKYGIAASGSAKTSFVSTFKQNSFSIYVLVQVEVINEQTLLDLSQAKLSSTSTALFKSNPQQFITQYGDSFVYGLITGGEFFAVLEIESSTVSEFREIKASLGGKASFGLFSGSASAEFEKSLQRITSSYKMKATIFRNGGSGVLGAITPSALVQQALDFPSEVVDGKAIAYEALIIPYNHIPHPVASPLDVSNQTTVLEQLGAWRQRLLKFQNDLAFALNYPEQFPGINISQINDRYNDISAEITNIVNSASACYADQSKCNLPTINLLLLESILPPQIEGVVRDAMISGNVSKSYWTTGHPLELGTPIGGRSDTIHIDFPAGKFSTPPNVQVTLSMIDAENDGSNIRLSVSPVNITTNGFDIQVSTWLDSKVYAVGVTWLAHAE